MSDNIQDFYKKEFSEINPSPEFLNNLTDTLKNEQANSQRRHFSLAKIISAAAAVVLIAGIGGTKIYMDRSQKDHPSTTDVSDVDIKLHPAEVSGMKPVSRPDADYSQYAEWLCQRYDSGELDYIKVNDTNIFTDVPEADMSEAEKLFELLADSQPADGSPNGTEKYYMLVFSDSTVEKLIVTDDKFIEISGKNIFFEKK